MQEHFGVEMFTWPWCRMENNNTDPRNCVCNQFSWNYRNYVERAYSVTPEAVTECDVNADNA
jgi:hypothetical protein